MDVRGVDRGRLQLEGCAELARQPIYRPDRLDVAGLEMGALQALVLDGHAVQLRS